MIAIHLVARSTTGTFPLRDPLYCTALWRRLQKRFPRCYAAVLMPNHLHLILPINKGHNEDALFLLGVCLRATSQALGTGRTWERSPRSVGIPDRHHLRRQIRYVHLNPCRAKLIHDPGHWIWSTHQDLIGAVFPRWLDVRSLARIFGSTEEQIAWDLHRYITGDPSVSIGGLPFPQPTPSMQAHPQALWAAVAAAGRNQISRSKKIQTWVRLCRAQSTRPSFAALANTVGIRRQTLHRAAARSESLSSALLHAVELQLTFGTQKRGAASTSQGANDIRRP